MFNYIKNVFIKYASIFFNTLIRFSKKFFALVVKLLGMCCIVVINYIKGTRFYSSYIQHHLRVFFNIIENIFMFLNKSMCAVMVCIKHTVCFINKAFTFFMSFYVKVSARIKSRYPYFKYILSCWLKKLFVYAKYCAVFLIASVSDWRIFNNKKFLYISSTARLFFNSKAFICVLSVIRSFFALCLVCFGEFLYAFKKILILKDKLFSRNIQYAVLFISIYVCAGISLDMWYYCYK